MHTLINIDPELRRLALEMTSLDARMVRAAHTGEVPPMGRKDLENLRRQVDMDNALGLPAPIRGAA